jgi:hypothetical protein
MARIGTTLTLTGTSAGGAIAATSIRIPFPMKIIGVSLYLTTGGTAAGPVLNVVKSLAGTGADVAFGTATFGTQADATLKEMSVTETNVTTGDVVRLSVVGGTIASTPVIGSAMISYMELFETA